MFGVILDFAASIYTVIFGRLHGIFCGLLVVALFAGMVIGCAATRKSAVLVSDAPDGYVISYRFGGYWLNEYYGK